MYALRAPPIPECTVPRYLHTLNDRGAVVVKSLAEARRFAEARDVLEFVHAHEPMLRDWTPVRVP